MVVCFVIKDATAPAATQLSPPPPPLFLSSPLAAAELSVISGPNKHIHTCRYMRAHIHSLTHTHIFCVKSL